MRYLIVILAAVILTACGRSELPVPKPRSFPRILYPERNIQPMGPAFCSFDFDFPDYAQVEQKELYFDEKPVDPCWFDLYIPAFEGRIHFSYYPINSQEEWEEKRDQAFKLAGFHNKRASKITETPISRPDGLGGMAFDIDGPAASPYQFFLTDSSQHFVRAALYFNTQSRPDSLKPIINYVVEDIENLIETFEWK